MYRSSVFRWLRVLVGHYVLFTAAMLPYSRLAYCSHSVPVIETKSETSVELLSSNQVTPSYGPNGVRALSVLALRSRRPKLEFHSLQ